MTDDIRIRAETLGIVVHFPWLGIAYFRRTEKTFANLI